VDEPLRKLERLARMGGPDDIERFRVAYDRAYGSGAYYRRESITRKAQEATERRQVVNDVEAAIHANQGASAQTLLGIIAPLLTPLLERGEIDYYNGYAPGSGDPDVIVVTADWNEDTEYDPETRERRVIDDSLHRLGDLLGNIPGVVIDWSDGVSMCGGCNRAIETQPTSYGWTPPYFITDGDILCTGCIQDDPQPLLDELQGTTGTLSPALNINLGAHGYTQIPSEFQSGFHPGQNDSPQAVANLLGQLGLEHYIFAVDDVGQFDSSWSVWVEDQELQNWLWEANEEIENDIDAGIVARYVAHLLQNPHLIPQWPDNFDAIFAAIAPPANRRNPTPDDQLRNAERELRQDFLDKDAWKRLFHLATRYGKEVHIQRAIERSRKPGRGPIPGVLGAPLMATARLDSIDDTRGKPFMLLITCVDDYFGGLQWWSWPKEVVDFQVVGPENSKRNPDASLRALERQWKISGAWDDKLRYNVACLRANIIPPPDVEIEMYWGQREVMQSYERIGETDDPSECWFPKTGSLQRWFRRWHFSNGLGVSIFYNQRDPWPGMAPIPYQVPLNAHRVEAIVFRWRNDGSRESLNEVFADCPGGRKILAWPGDGTPSSQFISSSVQRLPLSDTSSWLQVLQETAEGKVP